MQVADSKRNDDSSMIVKPNRFQLISSVLWPSFIVAGIANSLFFTFFDPLVLTQLLGMPEVERTGVYSIGFLLFWIISGVSSAVTLYFVKPVKSS